MLAWHWHSCAITGARIVATILNDPKLNPQWYAECKGMADRIIDMRNALKKGLKDVSIPFTFAGIIRSKLAAHAHNLVPGRATRLLQACAASSPVLAICMILPES